MSRIVLGVAGGIAAYKACLLLRRFTEAGHEVQVVPTANALAFVGETTWAALSGNPVHTSVFADAHEVPHVRLGREADLVVVAPATADLLARAASGRADDLLTSILLTASCPVVMAPAMHTEMWLHPATQANVATLRSRGVVVLHPAQGRLTGADSGAGRLPRWRQRGTALACLADPWPRPDGRSRSSPLLWCSAEERARLVISAVRWQFLVRADGCRAGQGRSAARRRGDPCRSQPGGRAAGRGERGPSCFHR